MTLRNGKLQLNLVLRWLDDALRVETEMPLTRLLAPCDGYLRRLTVSQRCPDLC